MVLSSPRVQSFSFSSTETQYRITSLWFCLSGTDNVQVILSVTDTDTQFNISLSQKVPLFNFKYSLLVHSKLTLCFSPRHLHFFSLYHQNLAPNYPVILTLYPIFSDRAASVWYWVPSTSALKFSSLKHLDIHFFPSFTPNNPSLLQILIPFPHRG